MCSSIDINAFALCLSVSPVFVFVNMPESKSHFNQRFREKYPFSETAETSVKKEKKNAEVQCEKCRVVFKFSSDDNADIS